MADAAQGTLHRPARLGPTRPDPPPAVAAARPAAGSPA
jgi:hypothetical protein